MAQLDPLDRRYGLSDLGLEWCAHDDTIYNPHTNKRVSALAWRTNREAALRALGWREPGRYSGVYADYDEEAGF